MTKIPKQKLNLFLLRTGATLQTITRDDLTGVSEYSLSSKIGFPGRLLTMAKKANPPAWKKFIETGVGEDITSLLSQSASALLGVEAGGRIFCFVFGYARHWIPEQRIERRFGMLTTLNCVDHESLRAIDREEFEAISRTTRSQVSVSSSINVFGINPQRDLIRSVAGKPQNDQLAEFVAGSDALIFTSRVEFEALADKCTAFLKAYESVDYKSVYPWIDNFQRVKSKSETVFLDELLIGKLNSNDHNKLFLSPPNLTDPSEPVTYRYPGEETEVHDDLRLSHLLDLHKGAAVDLEWLQSKKFKELNLASEMTVRQFSVYDAIVFEAKVGKKLYVLSRGEWFEVSVSYVERVEADISSLTEDGQVKLPAAEPAEIEGAYNERVAHASGGELLLLDGKSVGFGGGYSRIEVCDLLSVEGHLLHVKAKTKSSTLSHLFTQGVVSAQLLRDSEFRQEAAKKIPGFDKIVALSEFDPKNHPVTFCIISSTAKKLTDELPFLSKQSLSNAVRELRLMGYPIRLNKIKVQGA